MKKLFIIFLFLAIFPIRTNAFEFALGPKYTGLGNVPNISIDSRLVQLETLIGPLQFSFGAVQDIQNAIPFTLGLINKFNLLPLAKPYLGWDITYISLPSTMGYYSLITQVKGGVELEYGSFGFYGGLGYAFVSPGSLTNFTWEIGSRWYILK